MLAEMTPIVYLTCELKGRDFRSRVLIAAHLVKMGYSVVVGQFWNLCENARTAPRGVYHFKTSNRVQAENMRMAKKYGHIIVAADEEALSTSEHIAAEATDPLAAQECDAYLAISQAHLRALVSAFPVFRHKFILAGTSRADIMRADNFERPHTKPYILINTSFGVVNSIWGDPERAIQVCVVTMGMDGRLEDHIKTMAARHDYENAALSETIKLIEWLGENDPRDVILRPHPNENADTWTAWPGLKIVTNSDPFPWTKYADVMIHSDSTTGIEAAIMGAPVINLSPQDYWARRVNTRDHNITVKTAAEAIALIQSRVFKGTSDTSEIAPFNAAETTARLVAKFLPPCGKVEFPEWIRTPRTDVQVRKMTVSLAEAQAAADDLFTPIGVVPKIRELDDSVFLFAPA